MRITDTVERGLVRSGLDVFSIGESECGLPILCAHGGDRDGGQLIVTAAIHARECYTALVVLRQALSYSGAGGVYFIPLVNPDGALFFENGETFGRGFLKRFLPRRREWKANACGVDLNCNFDANYGTGKYNVHQPCDSGYIGTSPLCAAESSALARFTESVLPISTVSYHCMGGELYWEFFQTGEARRRDKALASALAKRIGVKRVDGDLESAGGYKDYCVMRLGIPAFTVELIKSGSHPFAPSDFEADAERNERLPEYLHGLLAD